LNDYNYNSFFANCTYLLVNSGEPASQTEPLIAVTTMLSSTPFTPLISSPTPTTHLQTISLFVIWDKRAPSALAPDDLLINATARALKKTGLNSTLYLLFMCLYIASK